MPTAYTIRLAEELTRRTGHRVKPETLEIAMKVAKGEKPENKPEGEVE